MDLMEMMREAIAREEKEAPKLSAAEKVERMRAFAAPYGKALAFAVGDLVTPRAGSTIKGAGEPHLVVETRPDATPDFSNGEAGSNAFGKRLDLRILSTVEENMPMHWVEGFEFEPWVMPAEQEAEAKIAA